MSTRSGPDQAVSGRGVKARGSSPQRTTCSLAHCSRPTSFISWARVKSLLQTTKRAPPIFAGSRCGVSSNSSVAPCIMKLQLQSGPPKRAARSATSEPTFAKCAWRWRTPRRWHSLHTRIASTK